MTEPPILLRVPDAAHLLGISEKKLRYLVAERRIRAAHVDRVLCIHRADLEAFADQCRDKVTLRMVG